MYNRSGEESLASSIESQRHLKIAAMKGIPSALYIVQHLWISDHYVFPCVIGPYGFVPKS